MFFDERFKFVEEGSTYLRVNSADNSNASLTLAGIKAPKNGYVYVYVSNESDETVYFDNLQVAHNRGRIVEENHYYAFGLKIAGISSRKLAETYESNVENKYLYNDKELFEEGDLNWYDYGFRNYDAQLGRFTQLDPLTWEYPELTTYQYSGNDPIANVDLDGLEPKNVIKMLGSLSDQGINASSKLLEKGANAGKWLVSWIDKTGVAQLRMFASKSMQIFSTALNIGAKVADVGLDFVPIAGGARDIYRGVRDGNWIQAGIGALSIVADIFSFGSSSVVKGLIKNTVKEGVDATLKQGIKEAAKGGGQLLLKPGAANLTQKGLDHIVARHWFTSGAKGAGKFAEGTTGAGLKSMINTTTTQGVFRANTMGRAGTIAEYNFGRVISTTSGGAPASSLRVVIGTNGNVITAFPF